MKTRTQILATILAGLVAIIPAAAQQQPDQPPKTVDGLITVYAELPQPTTQNEYFRFVLGENECGTTHTHDEWSRNIEVEYGRRHVISGGVSDEHLVRWEEINGVNQPLKYKIGYRQRNAVLEDNNYNDDAERARFLNIEYAYSVNDPYQFDRDHWSDHGGYNNETARCNIADGFNGVDYDNLALRKFGASSWASIFTREVGDDFLECAAQPDFDTLFGNLTRCVADLEHQTTSMHSDIGEDRPPIDVLSYKELFKNNYEIKDMDFRYSYWFQSDPYYNVPPAFIIFYDADDVTGTMGTTTFDNLDLRYAVLARASGVKYAQNHDGPYTTVPDEVSFKHHGHDAVTTFDGNTSEPNPILEILDLTGAQPFDTPYRTFADFDSYLYVFAKEQIDNVPNN